VTSVFLFENLRTKVIRCKEILKNTALRRTIIILILILVIYAFAVFIGVLHYPKWYVITNFMLNRKHFETILSNKEIDNLTSVSQIDTLECTDEIQKSIKKLFEHGIYQGFRISYERDYSKAEYAVTDDVRMCIFTAKSSRYDNRGILYYNSDISTISLADGNVYRCYSLGDGWYYFQYLYKDSEKG